MKTELLAPGGNIENAKLALSLGADAVYVGLSDFSARSKCENFNFERLQDLMIFAKLHNKKVYVALNTIIKNSELESFFESVSICEKLGVDGIILQDLFLGKFLKEKGCKVSLHASTQSGICNADSAKVAEKFGFSRVILSRETSLEEIKEIRKQTSLEIEYFVQGALCVSFSGGCYFSSAIEGNSGNRGRCLQPCRKPYTLVCGEKEISGYVLSPKDLCLDSKIKDLISAGVCSFKIEGRLRRKEYTASSVLHYRSVIDGIKFSYTKRDLKVTFNRGDYTLGYLNSPREKVIYNSVQNHIGLPFGKVTKQLGKNRFFVESKQKPTVGDGFKLLLDGREIGGFQHQSGLSSSASGFEIFSSMAKVGAEVRLTTDKTLEDRYIASNPKIPLDIEYCITLHGGVLLTFISGDVTFEYQSDIAVAKAQNAPLKEENLQKNLAKLGDTIFAKGNISGYLEDDVFLGASQINEARRAGISAFEKHLKDVLFSSKVADYSYDLKDSLNREKSDVAIIRNLDFANSQSEEIIVYKPDDYSNKELSFPKNKQVFLYIPAIYTSKDKEMIKALYSAFGFVGLFAENIGGLKIASELFAKLFIGEKLNISNNLSFEIASKLADELCWSKELATDEVKGDAGYMLSYGGYEIMTFAHCPLICNDICTCNSCKYTDGMAYIDEKNRKFSCVRLKMTNCQFNLYYDTSIDARAETAKFSSISDLTVPLGAFNTGSSQRGIR